MSVFGSVLMQPLAQFPRPRRHDNTGNLASDGTLHHGSFPGDYIFGKTDLAQPLGKLIET